MNKALVYGDISPNVVDGSSIWLMSVTEAAARVFDEVHLLLKMPPQNRRLLAAVDGIDNVVVHTPDLQEGEQQLTVERASAEVAKLATKQEVDAVIARGMELCFAFSRNGAIARRLWVYITDLPFPPERISATNTNRLRTIALNSFRVFSQTEASRSYLETITPEAAGKTLLMRPMIPDEAFDVDDADDRESYNPNEKLRLVYAGKLAEDWKTLEMLSLPRELKEVGIDAELRVVGDKFNKSRENPQWVGLMREALEQANEDPESGVTWVGGCTRKESLNEIRSAHIGIGWRTAQLDSSLEISTKALEYSAAGTVPVVNRNGDNEEFYGADYPFFVDATDTAMELALKIRNSLGKLNEVRSEIRSAAGDYSFGSAALRFEKYFTRAGAIQRNSDLETATPIKLVVAAHDFKFLGELMQYLERNPKFEVRLDTWADLHTNDVAVSRELAQWADVVFCEWAGPNLRWYSHEVGEDTRLVSRLHGFELRGQWMKDVDFSRVDQMIFVSDFYRHRAEAQLELDGKKTVTIPNMLDALDFGRAKLPNSQFRLGMAGIVPMLKRPERALELLNELIKVDDRYTLVIRSNAPWNYPYVWNNPVQQQAYLEFYGRIAGDAALSSHVVFEDFGPQMGTWFRRIGVVLSPSDSESFHLTPAEGMASGAVPIVWNREGAVEVFGSDNVYENIHEMVQKILSLRDSEEFERSAQAARAYASRWDTTQVLAAWQTALEKQPAL